MQALYFTGAMLVLIGEGMREVTNCEDGAVFVGWPVCRGLQNPSTMISMYAL
jgi:hypothetical protein